MAKTRAKKETEIKDVVKGLREAKSVVFADVSPLKVNESVELRRQAKQDEVTLKAVKKTLLKRAGEEAGLSVEAGDLKGSVSLFLGYGDEIAPARVFKALKKEHKTVEVFGGLLESKWLSASEVQALADLPSRQELLAQLVGSVRAPLSGLVGVLQGPNRGLVSVLNAIKDAKSNA